MKMWLGCGEGRRRTELILSEQDFKEAAQVVQDVSDRHYLVELESR